jgi:hypothetical protein
MSIRSVPSSENGIECCCWQVMSNLLCSVFACVLCLRVLCVRACSAFARVLVLHVFCLCLHVFNPLGNRNDQHVAPSTAIEFHQIPNNRLLATWTEKCPQPIVGNGDSSQRHFQPRLGRATVVTSYFDHQQAPTRCAPILGSSSDAHLEIYFSY